MKYIVAVKYKDVDSYIKFTNKDVTDLVLETEIFEFKSKENRSKFIDSIKHLAEDIALSQIEEIE
jgi:hypothetical protein